MIAHDRRAGGIRRPTALYRPVMRAFCALRGSPGARSCASARSARGIGPQTTLRQVRQPVPGNLPETKTPHNQYTAGSPPETSLLTSKRETPAVPGVGQGIAVSERGRIPASVAGQYEATSRGS